MDCIIERLRGLGDDKFADFQAKLVPNVERENIIGVRTPVLRSLAKELLNDGEFCSGILPEFLNELPHRYFDENILQGEFISKEKDFVKAIELTRKFLPYVDNWAVCDLLAPKVFAKHKDELFPIIRKWLESDLIYTVRFGIDMMIKHFLDAEFKYTHLSLVNNARGDDYYIKMSKAWYFSFALIKHYEDTLAYFKNENIDGWIYKKSIQKARESYRVSDEHKDELKALLKHELCI